MIHLDKKGRIVVGGNKQNDHNRKKEVSSCTSHTESTFSTGVITAMHGRYVAIVDIPNAFVHTDLIKRDKWVKIIMVIRKTLDQIICEILPETYQKHITTDKRGNLILYVRLLKAL